MDSEWLNKVLNSYLECIEQSDFDWQRSNNFFEESEELWFDHAATKFRQHYLVEIRKSSLSFIDGLNQQHEIMTQAQRFIENGEVKKRALNIHFDDFSQLCSGEKELNLFAENNIKATEREVKSSRRKMADVHNILRQIS